MTRLISLNPSHPRALRLPPPSTFMSNEILHAVTLAPLAKFIAGLSAPAHLIKLSDILEMYRTPASYHRIDLRVVDSSELPPSSPRPDTNNIHVDQLTEERWKLERGSPVIVDDESVAEEEEQVASVASDDPPVVVTVDDTEEAINEQSVVASHDTAQDDAPVTNSKTALESSQHDAQVPCLGTVPLIETDIISKRKTFSDLTTSTALDDIATAHENTLDSAEYDTDFEGESELSQKCDDPESVNDGTPLPSPPIVNEPSRLSTYLSPLAGTPIPRALDSSSLSSAPSEETNQPLDTVPDHPPPPGGSARCVRELRLDLRTLDPAALFALETWRREVLGEPRIDQDVPDSNWYGPPLDDPPLKKKSGSRKSKRLSVIVPDSIASMGGARSESSPSELAVESSALTEPAVEISNGQLEVADQAQIRTTQENEDDEVPIPALPTPAQTPHPSPVPTSPAITPYVNVTGRSVSPDIIVPDGFDADKPSDPTFETEPESVHVPVALRTRHSIGSDPSIASSRRRGRERARGSEMDDEAEVVTSKRSRRSAAIAAVSSSSSSSRRGHGRVSIAPSVPTTTLPATVVPFKRDRSLSPPPASSLQLSGAPHVLRQVLDCVEITRQPRARRIKLETIAFASIVGITADSRQRRAPGTPAQVDTTESEAMSSKAKANVEPRRGTRSSTRYSSTAAAAVGLDVSISTNRRRYSPESEEDWDFLRTM